MGMRRHGISLRYLTRSLRSLVRYQVKHEWWKFLKGTPVNIINSFFANRTHLLLCKTLWKVSLEMVCSSFNLIKLINH